MSEGLDKLAHGVGKAIETVPEVYQDAFQLTVQETGKLVSRIPRAINAAFSGLDKWILNKEYSIDETKKLIAQKLENVDPEKIVAPEAYVAIPALQAISYSMDSQELRDLYANLLSKAMNIETKSDVHPAFVDIISSLSPLDTRVFKFIIEHQKFREIASLEIRSAEINSTYIKYIARHVTAITFASYIDVECSIYSLIRCQLITSDDFRYADKALYQEIKNTPDYIQIIKEFEPILAKSEPQEVFKVCERAIKSTRFGKQFYDICVAD